MAWGTKSEICCVSSGAIESIEARMHITCSQNCTTSLVDDAICGRSQLINCCFTGLDTEILSLLCTVNQHTCPVQVQRLDVQKIDASTTMCLLCWYLLRMVADGDKTTLPDNITQHHLTMNVLCHPYYQALLHLMIQTLWLMCTGTTTYVPRIQYSAQMCITPMQAHVSTLHHATSSVDSELWCNFRSSSIASSDLTHKPCDRCGLERSAENRCADISASTTGCLM